MYLRSTDYMFMYMYVLVYVYCVTLAHSVPQH